MKKSIQSNSQLDAETNEYEEITVDEEYIEESYSDESSEQNKKSKKKERRLLGGKTKSLLSEAAKKKKRKRTEMIGFLGTLLLMFFVLLIYSVSYLLAPAYVLEANVEVVKGGYALSYPLCESHVNKLGDVDVGDVFYINVITGRKGPMSRESIEVKVVSIDEDGKVQLEFAANEIPYFISTKDMKAIIQTNGDKQMYSSIKIKGKIVINRFSILKISTE